MVVVCLTFVAAGVVALRRPPYARFGLLLAAVGLSALLGALHDANAALPYTVGVLSREPRLRAARARAARLPEGAALLARRTASIVVSRTRTCSRSRRSPSSSTR